MDSAILRRGQQTADLLAAADVLMANNERMKCALRDVFGAVDSESDSRQGFRVKVPSLPGCNFCSPVDEEVLREPRLDNDVSSEARWVLQQVSDAVQLSRSRNVTLTEGVANPPNGNGTAQYSMAQSVVGHFQRSFESEYERYATRCLSAVVKSAEASETIGRIQSASDLRTATDSTKSMSPLAIERQGGQVVTTPQLSTSASTSRLPNPSMMNKQDTNVPVANANTLANVNVNATQAGWSVRTELHTAPPFARLESALKAQSYKCPSCGAIFSNLSSTEHLKAIAQRFCEYSNAFYCATCFGGQRAYVPARILRLNDYRPVAVSSAAYFVIRAQFNTPQFSVIDIERMFGNPIRERVKQFAELHVARVRLFFLLSFIDSCTTVTKPETGSKLSEISELYTLLNDKTRVPAHFHLQNLDAIRRVRFREYELFMDDPDAFLARSGAEEYRPRFPEPDRKGESIRTTLQLADENLVYSVGDLFAAKCDDLLANVQKLVALCTAHVTRHCYLCKQKGYICEACHAHEVLYPFNVPAVLQCAECNSCFHTPCIDRLAGAGQRCPRCVRLERRATAQRSLDLPSADEQHNTASFAHNQMRTAADAVSLSLSVSDYSATDDDLAKVATTETATASIN